MQVPAYANNASLTRLPRVLLLRILQASMVYFDPPEDSSGNTDPEILSSHAFAWYDHLAIRIPS